MNNINNQFLKEININVRSVNHLKNCNNANHKLPWRRLYDYELVFVVDGEISVKTQKEMYTVKKNQLHIMPPFLYHTRFFQPNAHCTYYDSHIDFFYNSSDEDFSIHDAYIKPIEHLGQEFPEEKSWINRKHFEGIKVPSVIDIHDPVAFTKRFKELLKVYRSTDDPFRFINLKSKGYMLLHLILNECEKNGVSLFRYNKNLHIDIISDFIQLVKEQYMNEIDLKELATTYGLSTNHFAKIFKKQMDIAPHDYIIAYRIEVAKNLLKSGKYYINEIANMVGYENVAYFSRLFKNKEGVNPSHYLTHNPE